MAGGHDDHGHGGGHGDHGHGKSDHGASHGGGGGGKSGGSIGLALFVGGAMLFLWLLQGAPRKEVYAPVQPTLPTIDCNIGYTGIYPNCFPIENATQSQ